jgi:DNA-binding SARP family transcriptional activator/WD40 repeat protein
MRFRLLGSIDVGRDDDVVSIGGPQQRRLLAVLLSERGRAVSTQRLVDALWPDGTAPQGALRSTMSYVSRLRAVLGDNVIVTNGAGYRLELNGHGCDADEFESLVDTAGRALPDVAVAHYDTALALWRGPPYGEFTGEWWALAESTRLTEQRVVAREQRAAALMAMGHRNWAIPDLETLSVEHPLRERPVVLLMQALQATGRQAEALRQARRFRTRLVDETGLEPSDEFTAVERSVIDRAPLAPMSGRPLRGYTIHEMLGEGAYGRVYAATQPGTERRVAVKVIRPELADSPDFVRRFESEAQLVARLEHPHIVPLYDYWREPGGAYLVFRLLTGGTARDAVIADGPWSLARVSRVVEEVGGALIAAHAAGVVHNDVRTSNVLLGVDGCAYLSDFGIAVAIEPADVDGEQGDVNSFAWLLWELLTGSPASAERSRPSAIGGTDPGPVPALVGTLPAVPEGLDAVLARASGGDGGYTSVAELVLGWRAAVGRPDGVLSPVGSSPRRAIADARRAAARHLVERTTAAANPYVGLRSFGEADASRFFGRASMVESLREVVGRHSLVAVVGASGSGKSSLVLAGLVPRMRVDGFTVVTMVPGDDPVGNLRAALAEVATVDLGSDTSVAMAAIASRGPLLIVVDQLEECWTRGDPARSDDFLRLLTGIAALDGARVVTTIRADLFDRPLQHALIGSLIGDGTFAVTPMSRSELGEAIVRPAARAGVSFAEDVVERLVGEAMTHAGSLPLLQFTLAEMYGRRTEDGGVDAAALEAVGGMAGSIGLRAEDVYTAMDAPAYEHVRSLFSRLVVPGDGAADTRRRARWSELAAGARVAASAFIDARLLVTDRDAVSREPVVEVAHEALLTRWRRLSDWIDEDRRWIAQLHHVAAAAQAWDDADRSDAELYRGARLESIIEAMDDAGRSVSALEREFVDAGVAARDAGKRAARRSARRLRRLLVGVTAALVVALVAGAVAVGQRGRADRAARAARVEALVGRADSLRATQRDTAALLAIEAYRMADTPRTRSALFSTFTADPGFLDAHRLPADRGSTGIVLPDGETALIVGPDGRLQPYDLAAGSRGAPLPAVGDPDDPRPILAAGPSGAVALVTRSDLSGSPTSTIGVIDTTRRALRFPAVTVAGRVDGAAFSSDGGRLAVATGDEAALVVLDATTGTEVAAVRGVGPIDQDAVSVRASDLGDALYFEGASSGVTTVDETFVIGSIDGSLRLVDVASTALRATIDVAPNTVSQLHPVGDGTVVAAGRAGLVRVDVVGQSIMWRHAELEPCRSLVVLANRGVFYCGDPFGRLVERDLATGVVLRRLDTQGGATAALWPARDGTEIVSFGDHEPVVARWRLDGSGPVTHTVATGFDVGMGFNPAGGMLLVGRGDTAEDADFRVIDVKSGKQVAALEGMIDALWTDDDTIVGGVLTDDGRYQGARFELTDADRGTIRDGPSSDAGLDLWAADPGKERFLVGRSDGRRAEIIAGDESGLIEPWIVVDDFVSMANSRSGHRIAVGTEHGVIVYDGATGTPLGEIRNGALQGVTITLADQLFVSSLGGELTQYDLESLQPIRSFGGSRGFVQEVISSLDGSLIAVRGGDRSVTLFDVASGARIGTPIDVPNEQESLVALSEQGDRMAIGGGDEAGIQIWNLEPPRWVVAACQLAGRNLTRDEWSSHIGDLAPYRATCPDLPLSN